MPRLIYNRIAKAGSTTMIALLTALSQINNFTLVNDNHYFPEPQSLRHRLEALPPDSVYINHCNFVPDMGEDYHWINMVRDPVEKDESSFYYGVSDERTKAKLTLQARKEDKKCGCAYMEYDECIRLRMKNDCSLKFTLSELNYFSHIKPHWDTENKVETSGYKADEAFQRVLHNYRFVGLTEEFALSIKVLEVLEPRFFKGASNVYASHKSAEVTNASPLRNHVTHTYMTGAISSAVRSALSHANPEDVQLYYHVKRLFWWTVGQLLQEEISYGKTVTI